MSKRLSAKQLAAFKRRKDTLSPQQERFVQEYLIDGNATAAYKRAGYKPRSDRAAAAAASVLLTLHKVAAKLAKGRMALAERTAVTTAWVVAETRKNYDRCVDAEELSAANKALELLGRHTGAFPHKHEVTNVPTNIDDLIRAELDRLAAAGQARVSGAPAPAQESR